MLTRQTHKDKKRKCKPIKQNKNKIVDTINYQREWVDLSCPEKRTTPENIAINLGI